MKRLLIFLTFALFIFSGFAQVAKVGETFTGASIPVIEDKVTFLKEIPLKKELSEDDNYKLLREWAISKYGKDPFISSLRHDKRNKEFIAKSRIELLLPENSKGVREKMVMRYRMNGFLFQDKCVLEITEISYMSENASKNKILPRINRAEDFISDAALEKNDEIKEYRENTRKATLYFLDEIGEDFEKKFGYENLSSN
ncbi:MAG: hypothetical protein LBV43_05220 [Prevotella sp.]|jgi:hypothetical protein|nr:hypothetical protein [Prevotella sp.]